MSEIKRIVCCTDFSAEADKAFDAAADMAEKTGAHLFVLNVIPAGSEFVAFGEPNPSLLPDEESITQRAEARYVAKAGVDAEVVVRYGSPAKRIIEFVKEQNADLVVIGARGVGRVAGLLGGGSVADKVVKNSPVPVLVVPD